MGSIYRRAKTAYYNYLNSAAGGDGSYVFDALMYESFDTIYTTVSSGALAKSSIQARLWLPQDCVIVKVVFGAGAYTAPTGTGLTAQYNIVVGEGSTYHAAVAQTFAVAGTEVFSSDVSFETQASPPFGIVSVPTVPEGLYSAGQELTLRLTLSGGSTNGTVTNVKVTMLLAVFDPFLKTTSANPSTDF